MNLDELHQRIATLQTVLKVYNTPDVRAALESNGHPVDAWIVEVEAELDQRINELMDTNRLKGL